jgi:hypothetical protein
MWGGPAIVARGHEKNLRLEERQMWGWIPFALLFVWYIASMIYTSKRINNLESHVIFLLLSDDIRADHKMKLEKWISKSKETRAADLRARAGDALQLLADSFAEKGSILSSPALIWKHKRESDTTEP